MSNKINYNYASNMMNVFEQLDISVLLSTYQSNKIMILGQDSGKIDVRYQDFKRPMGMCRHNNDLYAGIGHAIYQFSNYSTLAQSLEGENKLDACYLPQNIQFTADIDIHEMEYCQDELYFINTKFSCLCIKEPNSSFKPIWKPPFISLLQPIDKCHLNGFCTKDGKPKYVTCLGETDEALGWRENKVSGGILMDIETNEVLLRGLSMPHSPRWYQGKLYFLESGKGSLSYYDFNTQKSVEIAKVPGFTRGLDIIGNLAFIGVSKVRESATFSGLEITQLPKRVCGLWIVNIQTGATVSFFEFTEGIDELFAVTVMPHKKVGLFGHEHDYSKQNYKIDSEDIKQVKMPESSIEIAAPHFEKGNDLFNEDKKEEAIVHYQKALDAQDDYLPATFNMAIALGDLGRFEEAKEILKEVIVKDASIIGSYDSLAYLYYKQGNLKEAKEQYLKVLDLEPQNQKALSSLNIIKREMHASV